MYASKGGNTYNDVIKSPTITHVNSYVCTWAKYQKYIYVYKRINILS